jgi:hypothetical protein
MAVNFSDESMIKYLKMAYKFLQSRNYDIDEMDIDDLYNMRELDFLMRPLKLSRDERLDLEYLWFLISKNYNRDFEKELIKPILNHYGVAHKVTERIRKVYTYEQTLESYLDKDEFDTDYVHSMEMNDEFFIYDGEVTDEEIEDSDFMDSELYDVYQQ